jgi:hypothetical protein
MLEEKTVVSTILRRYRIEAMQEREKLQLKVGIMRPLHTTVIRM